MKQIKLHIIMIELNGKKDGGIEVHAPTKHQAFSYIFLWYLPLVFII